MTDTAPWVSPADFQKRPAIRLFCFPYAGGSESVFRDWQRHLPGFIEVCAVRLPGRGVRIKEPAFTVLDDLVQAAALGLVKHINRPFAVFGHSMGAIIAFELARQLRREYGLEPVHLFVSGRCSPQTVRQDHAGDLPDSEFIDLLKMINGTTTEALGDPELMQLMLPVLRADFALGRSHTHRLEAPLASPITVFGGLEDPTITRACLEGWREHTRSEFRIRMLPGSHFFLNTEQPLLLMAIARELHQYL